MRKIFAALLLAVTGCATAPHHETVPVSQMVTSSYTCYQPVDQIKVDGQFSEQSWQLAQPVQLVRYNGETSPVKTTAKMLWDDQAIYIAAECEDTDIFNTFTKRDDALYKQDVFEVFVMDAKSDAGHYLEYEFSPSGTIFDLYLTAPFRGQPFTSEKVQVAAVASRARDPQAKDNGWQVEIAIPFEDFAAETLPAEVKMNLYRIDCTTPAPKDGKIPTAGEAPEFLTWSPTGEVNFHMPKRFGTVTLVAEPVGEK